jgi:uncharacterized protein (DUF433 family)
MEIPVSHIEIVDGKAMIKGRQVKVKMVAGMYLKTRATIEAIMEQYGLSAAEVHSALAYYYDHQAVFDEEDRQIQPMLEKAQEHSEDQLAKMREKAKKLRGD